MNWGALQALWLLLLAIPTMALFLRRRRARKAAVPSILFWQQNIRLARMGILGRRLRRLITLLVQLCVLCGLCLAVARPMWPSESADNVVLVVDCSATMQTEEPGGLTRLEIAMERAITHVEQLPDGARCTVIRAGSFPEVMLRQETDPSQVVGALARKLARTEVAYLPSATGVDLRVLGRGKNPAEAARTADRATDMLAGRLEPFVYARGPESLEEVVAYLLTMEGKTLATAESCTAGGLGARVTNVPGSSGYFLGGVVAYSDELKRRLLGVKAGTLRRFGAVSKEVASEMATGARDRARSDYALAVTGIAGPSGGSTEKPVGLVYIGIARERGVAVRQYRFAGSRAAVRERAAQAALELLRRDLLRIGDES